MDIDLSRDAVAVLLFIARQRLRLSQNIPISEVRGALNECEERLRAALAECVGSGWLLVSYPPGSEAHYSMMATGGRRVARLAPRLH